MNEYIYHTSCEKCGWRWKIELSIGKRARRRFLRQMTYFEQKVDGVSKPKSLTPHVDRCQDCSGRGIISSENFPEVNHDYPHVAIVGGGIWWFALATACLHRGIPYTLYERDETFNTRSQWYGLTLQQASKAMAWLWIYEIPDGLISIMHKVHLPSGKVIWEWWRRKLSEEELQKRTKPRNIHISRQWLRMKLLDQTHGKNIFWGHYLRSISHNETWQVELEFQVGDSMKALQADLVVGADGIRSKTRNLMIGDKSSPLRYLGCIVILGVCPLEKVSKNPLLDWETVFQTVNGHERIYMMPYDADNVMWQMSFLLGELQAKALSKKWSEALKLEAIQRLWDWHEPIPEILEVTDSSLISGYPVYDREILDPKLLKNIWNVTLLGDAMHPMSPFKWQWANQAILDALDLARDIAVKCGSDSNWREKWLRSIVLEDFEKHILSRSTPKVRDSARAVKLLHSDAVLHDKDTPRSRGIE